MSEPRVDRIDVGSATEVWGASPHATIFTRPDVLARFFDDVHWWGASKNGRLLAAWPVPVDRVGRPAKSGWFYFVGPIWDGTAFPPVAHRALSGTLSVYTGFIEAFVSAYGGFAGSLPPPQTDVRAFTWWRYEQGAPVDVRPRYTARIGNMRSRSMDDILAEMRQLRRREMRRDLSKEGVGWATDINSEELAGVYSQRVPGDLAAVRSDAKKLLSIIRNGAGFTTVARDRAGEVVAVVAVLCDESMGNVVINSVADDWRASGASVQTMIRAISQGRQVGLDRFDFNGANSPARGDDKHSYGAEPVLYFDVAFGQT